MLDARIPHEPAQPGAQHEHHDQECARSVQKGAGTWVGRRKTWLDSVRLRFVALLAWQTAPRGVTRSLAQPDSNRRPPGSPPRSDTSNRRPEGARTNQPRATPWELVVDPPSSPIGAKQFLPFPQERPGTSIPWRLPLQGCAALTGLALPRLPCPRALPWADLLRPLRGRHLNGGAGFCRVNLE